MAKLNDIDQEAIDKILEKDKNDYTKDDVAHLRARASYISKDILNEANKTKAAKELEKDIAEKAKREKEDDGEAEELSDGSSFDSATVEEIVKGRKIEEIPTKQLNKLAIKLGIPEEGKKDRDQLIEAIKSKLGPDADQNPQ